jgi:hypothetical protein
MESRGDQENIIRGTRQRQFCLLPRLESGRMNSINGLDFDPISRINTGIDVFAMVGPVSAMPGRMPGRMVRTLKVEGSVRPVQFPFSSTVFAREPTQGKSSVWGCANLRSWQWRTMKRAVSHKKSRAIKKWPTRRKRRRQREHLDWSGSGSAGGGGGASEAAW